MQRNKLSFAQQHCLKKSGLLLQRSGAIWPGARIGIAVSGGVDSFVMLQSLYLRQRLLPFGIELFAIHLNPGFADNDHVQLSGWLAERGIPSHVEMTNFGPRAHSSENRRNSPCFFCAWRRRKRFFELCATYRLTHLALGHNADDLAATFMLNLLRNGSVRGMSMRESFFKGKLTLIRPMLLVEKKYIRQAARQWALPVWKNACPSAGMTARSEMESLMASLAPSLPNSRRSLLNAVMRWQLAQDASPDFSQN